MIVKQGTEYEVVALLPAAYAPQLRPGMTLFTHFNGYPGAHESARIASVGAEILGTREIGRPFGARAAASVTRPVVIVTAALLTGSCSPGGRIYPYLDSTAEARTRVYSGHFAMVALPGLRTIFERIR